MGPYAGEAGRDTCFEEWKVGVEVVSRCPNIVVKVGGCGMVNYGFGFEHREDPPDSATLAAVWQPYVAHVIECFGSSRCMFESNFPVDKLSCSYGNLWNAFKRIADDLGLSRQERDDLFRGTAARSYSMNVAT